jgi:hypothetical protein
LRNSFFLPKILFFDNLPVGNISVAQPNVKVIFADIIKRQYHSHCRKCNNNSPNLIMWNVFILKLEWVCESKRMLAALNHWHRCRHQHSRRTQNVKLIPSTTEAKFNYTADYKICGRRHEATMAFSGVIILVGDTWKKTFGGQK